MADQWREPTADEARLAERVQHELIDAMNLLGREGIDPRIILAGAGSAVADLVASRFGMHAVPRWFATQAKITADAIAGCDS